MEFRTQHIFAINLKKTGFCATSETEADNTQCGRKYDGDSDSENDSIATYISSPSDISFFFWDARDTNVEQYALQGQVFDVDNEGKRIQLRGRPLPINQQLALGNAMLLLYKLSDNQLVISTGKTKSYYRANVRGVGRILQKERTQETPSSAQQDDPFTSTTPSSIASKSFADYSEGRYEWGYLWGNDRTQTFLTGNPHNDRSEDAGHGAVDIEFMIQARLTPFNIGNSSSPFPAKEDGTIPDNDTIMKKFANTLTQTIYCNTATSGTPFKNSIDFGSCSGTGKQSGRKASAAWLDLAAWDDDSKLIADINADINDNDYSVSDVLNKVYWVSKCAYRDLNDTSPSVSLGYAKLAKWAERLNDTISESDTQKICDAMHM